MNLPYIVVRSNNLELSALESVTQSHDTEMLLVELATLNTQLETIRQAACERIFQLASNDDKNYKALINFRRKLASNKNPENLLVSQIQWRYMDSVIDRWFTTVEQWQFLRQKLEQQYSIALQDSRLSIKRQIGNEHFSRAISFARGDISNVVRRYLANAVPTNKKLLNDEDTILRYLNRAITKVSPFSSFTSIGFSALNENANGGLQRQSIVDDRFSFDRSVVLKTYEKLLIKNKQYWRYKFSANFTESDNQRFFYSFMDDDKVYPFRTSVVKAKIPSFNTRNDQWFDYKELLALVETSKNPDVLINKWLEAGILIYDLRLNDQAGDIFVELSEKIKTLQQRGFAHHTFIAKVAEIVRLNSTLKNADHITMPGIVKVINDEINALSDIAGYTMIKSSGLVYHDTFHPKISSCDKNLVNDFGQQISEFLSEYLGGNYDTGVSQKLMTILRDTIQPGEDYSLFQFYDIVTEALKKDKAGKNKQPSKSTTKISKLLSLFNYIWTHRNEKVINLPEADDTIKEEIKTKAQPFSAYGHIVDNKFVLNCVDSGYLRVYSRFFTFTDDDTVLQSCREAYGNALSQSYDFYDTFGFNTGRRPRLSSRRIWLDDFGNKEDGDIQLKDITMRWDQVSEQPQIFLKGSDEPMTIRHTALFVTQLYPKLLELLVRFSMSEEHIYFATRFGIFDLIANAAEKGTETGLVKIPRVCYKDVVISRQQWWLPQSHLPQQSSNQSSHEFFLQVDAWRRAQGLPQRVFVRRHLLNKVLERDVSNAKKPLFVDFSSPIQARPIARMMRTEFDYISFEEMLPTQSDTFVANGEKRFASEIIFERSS